MRIRLQVEAFEVEIGGERRERHPLAEAFAAAVAPVVGDWIRDRGAALLFSLTGGRSAPRDVAQRVPEPAAVHNGAGAAATEV